MLNVSILVAAHDRETVQHIATLLQDAGYPAPATASSASDAVRKIKDLYPGLVIIETTLRKKNDGVEAIKKIKKSLEVPVIYLASQDTPEPFRLARGSDPLGYLPLPVTQGELCIAVEAALRCVAAEKKLREVEKLRKSREDLNRAQAVAHTGNWRLDVRKNELLWSDEVYRIFGISVGTPLTYESFLAAVHPEDREFVDRSWQAALSGTPYDIEHRIVTGPEVKWVRELAELELDKDGSLRGGFGIVQDISERKRMEEALREKTNEIENFFSISLNLMCVADTAGYFRRLNQSWVTLLGYSLEELMERRFLDFIHPDDVPSTLDAIDRLACQEAVVNFVNRYRSKDGAYRWLEWYAQPSGDIIYAAALDITDRKKAETALLSSEENLKRELSTSRTLADLSQTLISSDLTIQQISVEVFNHARNLTGSRHGYAAYIDPETRESVAYHLTEMMGGECEIAAPDRRVAFPSGPDGRYPGLWGHALNTRALFYDNDARRHPSAKGTPPGHVPIERFLCVPALIGDTLLGNIALANPSRDFNDHDLEIVKRIADLYALAIQRVHYEIALEEANETLEQKARERSQQLYQTNDKLIREIEERKKAEEALRRSEFKFRTVADFTYAGEYWVDALGNYIYVSPSVERITGYRPDEFMADRDLLTNIVHRDDREKFINHIHDEYNAREPREIDFRIIRKDGAVRNIAHVCNPVYGEAGEFIGRRASNRDVTVQRQAEIRLREGEEVANALINTPTEPVLLTGTDGTIIDANDELVKRLGRKRKDIIGTSMYDIISEDMVLPRRNKIDAVLKAGNALRFEEGSGENWFDTIIYPVCDHQGMITKLAIFSHDITEMRRMQKDIMAISELERRRIGQELHDSLGQKLTGIGFLAEALKQTMQEKSYPEVADIEEIIYNVTDSIDHARKISSGLWSERFESYDAVQALEELAADTRNLFKIACLFNYEIAKPIKNKTVVTNLYYIARESVNNAIKHGKADLIELTLKEDDEQIYLKIENNARSAAGEFEKKKGIGLRIMRCRAAIIGGTVDAGSDKKGFAVFVAIKKEFIRNYLD
ncbi:MAG: hypothetical protein A2W19_08485 [Spirochaetes bacterium RBG_16_49_21]|nr:MAG: hypothetical protein A2W19_08485 [Spirochaetes bacterium RBG_16_49_21]